MDSQAVKLVCFSPTGTSKAVVKAVAGGLGLEGAELVDITRPEARKQPLRASADELLVLAVPVYSGRLPVLVGDWLGTLELHETPAACIVVYGNRAFEDALLELTDIVRERGGAPVAGAAFIGEHSFSSEGQPVAVARPDADDLEQAAAFGHKVGEALQSLPSAAQAPELAVPGNRPYKERKPGGPVEFIAVGEECVRCGVCAEVCPVEAIDPGNSMATDFARCIRCCACIKVCPAGARSMQPSSVMDVAKWLSANCRERKEPEFFF